MSALKETVEKTVNMVIPQDNNSQSYQRHSPQSSIMSTTSNLLKQQKQNDSFEKLEQNAQLERNRLSDMLDSVRNSSESVTNDDESFTDADDFIMNRKSNDSLPEQIAHKRGISSQTRLADGTYNYKNNHNNNNNNNNNNDTMEAFHSPSKNDDNDKFEFDVTQATPPKPKPLQMTPDLAKEHSNSVLPSPSSAFNRRSMISDYAPSIHEVNKVAYVVEGQEENNNEDLPVMEKHQLLKLVEISSGSSKKAEHEKNKESINSYFSNTNSGSGSSKYPESSYSGKDYEFVEGGEKSIQQHQQQPQTEKILEESESTSSFEFNLGPLKTTKGQQEPITMERSAITNIDPAVPSRSQRRPMSSACIKAPINQVKEEQEHNRPRSVDIGGIDNLMVELNKEIYNHPNPRTSSSELAGSQSDYVVRSLHERQESATNSINSETRGKSKRPLPPPPVPKHTKTSNVSHIEDNKDVVNDQDYVTEDEDKDETKSVKETKKKNKRKSNKSKKRISSGFKKGHFNHETLAQLLQVTEGTIIGQEFQNIGLESTEKQLLERLVDSLSRLTADMVIDSERHDESVRRLNKAIKALEGF